MKTKTSMTMTGVSDLICPREFQRVSDIVVERSERKMYSSDYHGMDKLEFVVFVGNPIGMPFVTRPEVSSWEDNGRRTWMFQVDTDLAPRLEKALDWAKYNNLWVEFYGEREQ